MSEKYERVPDDDELEETSESSATESAVAAVKSVMLSDGEEVEYVDPFIGSEWKCRKCGVIVVNPDEMINPTHDWDAVEERESSCGGTLEILGVWR